MTVNSDQKFALTRRAFATGITGSLATLGMADAAAAANHSDAPGNADLRDALLRGLARTSDLADPVLAAKAAAVLAQLQSTDPEAAMLVQVYRRYDVASATYGYGHAPQDPAANANLTMLHAAISDCRAVSFSYTDLEGTVTTRTALPLALVHPLQGIKLLAWCEKRQDNRQFFVRAIRDLAPQTTGFGQQRLRLLQGLAQTI